VRACGRAGADEGVQIVHKLLLDALNAALRAQAVRLHTSRAPRAGGGVNGAAEARGDWHELPDDEGSLQRMVDGAVQLTLGWLVHPSRAEGLPVEVQLSCLLETDAADVEKGWQLGVAHKERLIAETADTILGGLLAEYADELTEREARAWHGAVAPVG
jgi:hypothetical protein